MGTPEAVGLPVTGLSKDRVFVSTGSAVQEEYLTMMKVLQSFETLEATLQTTRVTSQKT